MSRVIGVLILLIVLAGVFYATYIFTPYSIKETIIIWAAAIIVALLIVFSIFLIVKN